MIHGTPFAPLMCRAFRSYAASQTRPNQSLEDSTVAEQARLCLCALDVLGLTRLWVQIHRERASNEETDPARDNETTEKTGFGTELGADFKPLGKRISVSKSFDGKPLEIKLTPPRTIRTTTEASGVFGH